MGRKNQRVDVYVPLDLTPAEIPKPRSVPQYATTHERRDIYWDNENKREERQRQARIAQGIDWSLCVVPGCGEEMKFGIFNRLPEESRRDPSLELPMCHRHLAVVVKMVLPSLVREGRFVEAIADLNEELEKRKARESSEAQAKFLAREDGDIYFIRIGDLVKVGWTRDLWSRIKSYGASAELLACYPATRSDETNLHRQLTPARAKGREW